MQADALELAHPPVLTGIDHQQRLPLAGRLDDVAAVGLRVADRLLLEIPGEVDRRLAAVPVVLQQDHAALRPRGT